MTRINLIPPEQLCDQHLMAEYRELIRIPNGVLSGKLKSKYPDAPTSYKLGSGHIKFFVDKLPWLFYRHIELYSELRYRGYNVEWMNWKGIIASDHYRYDALFTPTPEEINLNIQRIIERMPAKPRWTFRDYPPYWNKS